MELDTLAKRLRYARKERALTQVQLAELTGVKQSDISKLERGDSQKTANLLALARGLGANAHWLDTGDGPWLATEVRDPFPEGRPILALHAEDPVPDGVVLIKESRVRFAGGDGHVTPHYEEIEESLPATYRRAWFIAEGMNPAHVRRFQVCGDSMERTLFDGDTVLVHQKETDIRDGMVYAFRYGDELRIKRLYRRLNGGLEIRSDNPAFGSEEVTSDLANEHITIIGRVREKAGKGGL